MHFFYALFLLFIITIADDYLKNIKEYLFFDLLFFICVQHVKDRFRLIFTFVYITSTAYILLLMSDGWRITDSNR